jgi:hypothetical protein
MKKIQGIYVSVAGDPVEIRIGYLSNTNLEPYHYVKVFGKSAWSFVSFASVRLR